MKILATQFMRFAVTGVINTGIDFLTYIALTRLFTFWDNNKVLATSVAFIVANINSYILNRYWTFARKDKKSKNEYYKQYPKFLVISVVGLGLTALLFKLALMTGLYDMLAKFAPIPFVLLWNFIANKYWTFKDKRI